jgi:hypothetical protein
MRVFIFACFVATMIAVGAAAVLESLRAGIVVDCLYRTQCPNLACRLAQWSHTSLRVALPRNATALGIAVLITAVRLTEGAKL